MASVSGKSQHHINARSELSAALGALRSAVWGVALASGLINILALTSSIFMLQVYDRVIPSRSIPTLLGLAVMAIILYSFQGVMEVARSRLLVRIGGALDHSISERIYDILARLPLRAKLANDSVSPLRDLDQMRGFIAGPGLTALFDLPWIPLYLGICFLFHPLIGVVATLGALLLITLTAVTERLSKTPVEEAARMLSRRSRLAEASRRNAEVLQAMGFRHRLGARWQDANSQYTDKQQRVSDVGGGLSSISRVLRVMLQSTMLGIGAYLVIEGKASGGVMFASSFMMSRALAPVELSIANWRTFVAARDAWRRLNELLAFMPARAEQLLLPLPKQALTVAGVTIAPPGEKRVVVDGVTFNLSAGQGMGVIGPSGSGKSSLVRAIVGVWQPARGEIRLDGAELDSWDASVLGDALGYLPQDVELFDGTIAENICRFLVNPDPARVIHAAKAANVHDLILRLSDGYDTQIGEGGAALSAGQRQRIGLARALFGDPFLVVLDEPNANLDAEGEEALNLAISGVRNRGGIVIIVAHRPNALAAVDVVLVLRDGRQQAFGPRDEILAQLLKPAAPAARSIK
ncbi:type I secretion system permease/ATPase [soil metagenome]